MRRDSRTGSSSLKTPRHQISTLCLGVFVCGEFRAHLFSTALYARATLGLAIVPEQWGGRSPGRGLEGFPPQAFVSGCKMRVSGRIVKSQSRKAEGVVLSSVGDRPSGPVRKKEKRRLRGQLPHLPKFRSPGPAVLRCRRSLALPGRRGVSQAAGLK